MKLLYVTTMGETMGFFQNLTKQLTSQGHTVDIACASQPMEIFDRLGCKTHIIPMRRSVLSRKNFKAAGELKRLVEEGGYDIVHCHTPVASAVTRYACRGLRKKGLKVIYTAHGFHFFKGAPLKNWLFYYPLERLCARWTDVIVTINQEDYNRAKKHLHSKRIEHVHGVGINTEYFSENRQINARKREELNVDADDIVLMSIGELSRRKNHDCVIRALAELQKLDYFNQYKFTYIIAGSGELRGYLDSLAKKLNVDLRLLGPRRDVQELYQMADVFILPSLQEGLPVVLMEAVSCRLPVLCSSIRGNTDIATDHFFDCKNYKTLLELMKKVMGEDASRGIRENIAATMGRSIDDNYKMLDECTFSVVNKRMEAIYREALDSN